MCVDFRVSTLAITASQQTHALQGSLRLSSLQALRGGIGAVPAVLAWRHAYCGNRLTADACSERMPWQHITSTVLVCLHACFLQAETSPLSLSYRPRCDCGANQW